MLSDGCIVNAMQDGELGIQPYLDEQLQPSSYDVLLGPGFAEITGYSDLIDPREGMGYLHHGKPEFRLQPAAFVLATTVETITCSRQIAGRIEGKSSLARLGLSVHSAGFVDPGFTGQLTLEIYNHTRHAILLTAGMRIAQVCFFRLDAPALKPYSGRYQDQVGVTGSRFHQ